MLRTSLVLPLSALLLAVAAHSQQTVDPGAAMRAHGVVTTGGQVRGIGPGYSARFDERGIEYTPALGRAAERPFPVRFTMESLRRGASDVFVRTADVAPLVDTDRVRYVHGSDLTEVYDVRADGIEQSFVFATRPAGTGDLVVRGAITTELPLANASDDGVRYERDGLGGVTFGAVTGVDANGATVRGSIRATGDGAHVEWVLPAAFVDHARYPLVLDPLIGSSFTVGPNNVFDAGPRAAFDDSSNRYLVVWKVTISGTSDEVRAQLVGSTGTLIGPVMVLSSATIVYGNPEVANVNSTNRFLVTWSENIPSTILFRIMMRAVSAGSLSISSPVVVASTIVGAVDMPVIGGDSRPSGSTSDYACIVYRRSSPPQLEVRGVQVFAAADPVLIGSVQTVTTGNVAYPSLTKHAGTAGRWIAAWVHGSSAAGPFQNVACRVIGTFAVPCSATQQVSIGVASSDVRDTSVATSDGSDFVVAWDDEIADLVRVRPYSFTGACPGTFSAGLQVTPVTTPGFQSLPAIEFCKEKYLLTWLHNNAGATSVCVKGLSPATCASCGVEIAIEGASTSCEPDVVSRWSGGDTASDEGLVLWTNGGIRARRCEAVGNDVVAAMGGGCVSGFDDYATYNGDAVLGNANFQLAIAGSVSLPLVLIVGFSAVSAPCGGCTIVPSPDILFPATNPHPLAIPCDPLLVGVDVYTQWLLLKPSTCPILPDFSFTNALRFTIGE